jgi:LacI family transcriptional regulator
MAITIKDVAKLSGVHPSTVSRVIHGKENVTISHKTRTRILKTVKELNYQPDQTARALRLKKSNAIGLIIPNIASPYFSAIAKVLDRVSFEEGYSLLVYDTNEDQDKEIRAVNDLFSRGVDGLIIAPVQECDSHIRNLCDREFPFVLIDRCFDDIETNAVICNDEDATYDVIGYLAKLGHRRIGFISGRQNLYTINKRLGGYQRGLRDFNLEIESDFILGGYPSLESGYQSALKLLSHPQPPTALLVSGSIITIGVIRAITEKGLSIPDDMSLVGFTDSIHSPYFICPLTTISHSVEKIGNEAFNLLHHELKSKEKLPFKKIKVDTTFTVRKSTEPSNEFFVPMILAKICVFAQFDFKRNIKHIILMIPRLESMNKIFILLSTMAALLLAGPQKSEKTPKFWLDIDHFSRQDSYQIELYYSVSFNELVFQNIEAQTIASFTVSLEVKNTKDEIVFEQDRTRKAKAASEAEMKDEKKGIIDQINFSLAVGEYDYTCTLTDEHSGQSSTQTGQLSLADFNDEMFTSPPQFATVISKDSSQAMFRKANRTVLPNPSRRYQYHNSILYFYYEIYNLVESTSTSNTYSVSYSITDKYNDSLIVVPNREFKKPGISSVKMEAIDIRGLESGEHLISINVTDPASGKTSSTQSIFYVQQPVMTTNLPMASANIKRYRDQIKYIATKEELEIFDSLPPLDKQGFILNFWKSRDETPETEDNEFMMDYFSRFNYTAKKFRGKDGGENSDMGRVFIIYGQPDDIERFDMQFESKAFQIWQYFTGGGRHSFVFVDRNNEGIYSLVHSTVLEEIKNPDWKNLEL